MSFVKNNFFIRWICSTNHKDIGTLYLIFGVLSGLVGTWLSYFVRDQLYAPGNSALQTNYQLYNVMITAHALIMIFFLVMPVLVGGLCHLLGAFLSGLCVGVSLFEALVHISIGI